MIEYRTPLMPPQPSRKPDSASQKSRNRSGSRPGRPDRNSGARPRPFSRRPSRSGSGDEELNATTAPEGRGIRGSRQPSADDDRSDSSATGAGAEDTIRLQKFLAMAGVDSRRNCEDYIRTGRVTVDGEVVLDPARAINPAKNDIRLDMERLRPPRFRYFLVNKPTGFLCTNSDPQGRPRAVDLVPVQDQRLFTVGRLDENTEGLLLITNDGDLAQHLAHPKFEVVRRYRCQVAGIPSTETLRQLREGMYFSDGFFRFRSVHVHRRKGRSVILELELQEGKNREIRRLMARAGHKVLTLERIGFGPLQLRSLGPGRHRELLPWEVQELRRFAEHGEKPADSKPQRRDEFGYRPGQTRKRVPKSGLKPGQKSESVETGSETSSHRPDGPRSATSPFDGPDRDGRRTDGPRTPGPRKSVAGNGQPRRPGPRTSGPRADRPPRPDRREERRPSDAIEMEVLDGSMGQEVRREHGVKGPRGRRPANPGRSSDLQEGYRSESSDRPRTTKSESRRPAARGKGKSSGAKSFRITGKKDANITPSSKGRDRRRNK
ncbi:MAG: pseudouridine synthase [Planctomycetota bacterium]